MDVLCESATFKLHPYLGAPRAILRKKLEATAFYFLKCNTETLIIPLKCTYFDIYDFTHHQEF